MDIINDEETQFLKTLNRGRLLLERAVKKLDSEVLPGMRVYLHIIIHFSVFLSKFYVLFYVKLDVLILYLYQGILLGGSTTPTVFHLI